MSTCTRVHKQQLQHNRTVVVEKAVREFKRCCLMSSLRKKTESVYAVVLMFVRSPISGAASGVNRTTARRCCCRSHFHFHAEVNLFVNVSARA